MEHDHTPRPSPEAAAAALDILLAYCGAPARSGIAVWDFSHGLPGIAVAGFEHAAEHVASHAGQMMYSGEVLVGMAMEPSLKDFSWLQTYGPTASLVTDAGANIGN